ncbi:MAG: 23S rRNA (adenine(2503)-C(2))-methyltransferase RlmN [Gammaproteobacteria bacterium]|nr:23S rRNA (adenine(2503)-C(2))-methyltransferase RlmN [Gammaproteobacteria bacterium]
MLDTDRTNLLELDPQAMQGFVTGMGERSYRAGQLLKWIYHRGVTQFSDMTDLSKELRQRLVENAEIKLPQITRDQISIDGTRKWLLQVDNKNGIETVFIPDKDRRTLCISSQVGCALNCTFCATALHGYNRNLTTAEIIGQVWLADRLLRNDGYERPLSNIVLMGMGEPLLNFDNVVSAIRLMLDDLSFGLSRRRVTLSTAGVVPGIDKLREECPVSLAVSLHAPNDELRNQLVPLNRKYPIKLLLDACRRYVHDQPRSRITFEYTMIDNVNDSPEQARQLVRLLHDVPAKINLIPFNPFPGIEFNRSSSDAIEKFRDILYSKDIVTITRKTRGDDIDAACGQLAGQFTDRTKRSARMTSRVNLQ